jgi:hypothetical protein
MRNDFVVFILTHGRPRKQETIKRLLSSGYTGEYYYVIDNEDSTADEYRELYGDKVVQFDKSEVAKTFDEGDNFSDRRAIAYARNACYDIARSLGKKYFLELDDDYTLFRYMIRDDMSFPRGEYAIKSLDKVFDLVVDFYESTPASVLAFAQGGDYLTSQTDLKHMRKCMNTMFCSVDRQVEFLARMNEDVCTYTTHGNRGILFMTIPFCSVNQIATQSNPGGITELYKAVGTYVKSFYSVMYCPSSVTVQLLKQSHERLHHRIDWKSTVPKIVPERYKKTR